MKNSDMPLDPFSHPAPQEDGLFHDQVKVGINLALQLHAEGLVEEAKMIFEQVRRDARTHPTFAVLLPPVFDAELSELEGISQDIAERLQIVTGSEASPANDNGD